METNYAFHIAAMTVTEFRLFKRALAVLRRAGLDHQEAIHILIDARIKREFRSHYSPDGRQYSPAS